MWWWVHTIYQSYQSLTVVQQWGSLCYHRNRLKLLCLSVSLPDAALICQALQYPGNTMTSHRLCCLTGILSMHRQGWGTGVRSPNMLLQRLFSFLCSQFIHCNPFFPLSPWLPLSPVLPLSNPQFFYLFSFSPNHQSLSLSSSSSPLSSPRSQEVISSGRPNN